VGGAAALEAAAWPRDRASRSSSTEPR
jgi:hypothetical protein